MPQPQPCWNTPCRVVRVIDGDTVQVEVRRLLTVRLAGIDTPEIRTKDAAEKKRGLAAKDFMIDVADGETGVLSVSVGDSEKLGDELSFERVIGNIWLDRDDRWLSQRLIESGHAERVTS